MFHERVDRMVADIEKTGEGPAFALIRDMYSKKVKSFSTEEKKVNDVHYKAIYDTSKKSGYGHKLRTGVHQHLYQRPIAEQEPVATCFCGRSLTVCTGCWCGSAGTAASAGRADGSDDE
jgi:hypothetical protein